MCTPFGNGTYAPPRQRPLSPSRPGNRPPVVVVSPARIVVPGLIAFLCGLQRVGGLFVRVVGSERPGVRARRVLLHPHVPQAEIPLLAHARLLSSAMALSPTYASWP